MGQFQDRTMDDDRVIFDENSDNGVIIGGQYIPEDALVEIFCRTNYKSLLNCQLVCKRWQALIQNYVWRKKAEMAIRRTLPVNKNMPWYLYYLICTKKVFERNLVKNHSGEHGCRRHWKVLSQGGDCWTVENPPQGVPDLPNDPVFEGKKHCFVTSYYNCSKQQEIDLVAAGLIPELLDAVQPPIKVSEWYSCRWDCPAIYECSITLMTWDNRVLDTFIFRDNIEGIKQDTWHSVSHVFKNYGPGLRKVNFYHGGVDKLYWAGHFGSKMAGACVIAMIPDKVPESSTNPSTSLDVD